MADKQYIADKLRELQALIGEEKESRPPIRELWESWFCGMKMMKSDATVMSIRSTWKHLDPLIGSRQLSDITGELWTNMIIPKVRERTHPGFKFANCRKWLSMFMKWADENGKSQHGWRRPRLMDPDPEIEPGRAYTVDETTRLIDNADYLLLPKIILALDHFMRRSEIAFLSKERVDRKKQIIHLRAIDTKIRKARSFPYNDKMETLFKSLEEHNNNSPYIFPSPINNQKSIGRDGFSSAWATCKKNAHVIGRFHWLRHTALTRAFKAGGNPALICQMAGLDIKMAQSTYLHFSVDDLRVVIK